MHKMLCSFGGWPFSFCFFLQDSNSVDAISYFNRQQYHILLDVLLNLVSVHKIDDLLQKIICWQLFPLLSNGRKSSAGNFSLQSYLSLNGFFPQLIIKLGKLGLILLSFLEHACHLICCSERHMFLS